jgi:hypothetical protein
MTLTKHRTRRAFWTLGTVLALLLSSCGGSSSEDGAQNERPEQDPAGERVLISVGYDQPSARFISENIAAMQSQPLDGVVFTVNPGGNESSATLLDPTPWPEDGAMLERLSRIEWGRLRHNFIRLDTVAGDDRAEWFDDARWSRIAANMRLLARAAKTAKAKGLMFDIEPYGINPWQFRAGEFPGQSFADVRAQVRQRGAQFMQALQTEFPDIEVLCFFGPSIARAQIESYGGDRAKAKWGLSADFFDGMLDVIGAQARLIDGHEGAYYHTKAQQFDESRTYIRGTRELISPENRAKYDTQFGIAQTVYVDGTLDLWRSPRFFGHYFANNAEREQYAQHNLYHALRTSDRYVWLYGENMDWWNRKGAGVNVPAALPGIIDAARGKIAGGQALGLDIAPAVAAATERFDRRVFISGRIFPNGVDLGSTMVRSGPPIGLEQEDSACNTYRNQPDYWSYDCAFPFGWSGTLTIESVGRTFDPPQRPYQQLETSLEDQDFSARQ